MSADLSALHERLHKCELLVAAEANRFHLAIKNYSDAVAAAAASAAASTAASAASTTPVQDEGAASLCEPVKAPSAAGIFGADSGGQDAGGLSDEKEPRVGDLGVKAPTGLGLMPLGGEHDMQIEDGKAAGVCVLRPPPPLARPTSPMPRVQRLGDYGDESSGGEGEVDDEGSDDGDGHLDAVGVDTQDVVRFAEDGQRGQDEDDDEDDTAMLDTFTLGGSSTLGAAPPPPPDGGGGHHHHPHHSPHHLNPFLPNIPPPAPPHHAG